MFKKHLIPNTQSLSEGQALQIQIKTCDFLVMKQQGQIIAYENKCPHKNNSFSDEPDITLDKECDYLQCHHHGALFSPKDGSCITGPCQGSHLKRATVGIEKGSCYLLLP